VKTRAFRDGNWMMVGFLLVDGIMAAKIGNLLRNILHQTAAQGDADQLNAPADAEAEE
jgi:hypothetical protein